MATASASYSPLTYFAVPRGLLLQRLWLGDDHMLVVYRSLFREEYKRFYFKDIQAIAVNRNDGYLIVAVLLAVIAAVFALIASLFFLGSSGVGDIAAGAVFAIIAGVFLTLLGVNIAFGATCTCRLFTAVHDEHLFCIRRMRTAQRVLDRVRPSIELIQGVVTDETLGTTAGPGASIAARHATSTARPGRYEAGTWHGALFAMLFVDAIASLLIIVAPEYMPGFLSISLSCTVWILMVVAVVRQYSSDMPRPLRNVTWAAFAYGILLVAFNVLLQMLSNFRAAFGTDEPAGFTTFMQTLTVAANVISLICDLPIGTVGLFRLRAYRRAHKRRPGLEPGGDTGQNDSE